MVKHLIYSYFNEFNLNCTIKILKGIGKWHQLLKCFFLVFLIKIELRFYIVKLIFCFTKVVTYCKICKLVTILFSYVKQKVTTKAKDTDFKPFFL